MNRDDADREYEKQSRRSPEQIVADALENACCESITSIEGMTYGPAGLHVIIDGVAYKLTVEKSS